MSWLWLICCDRNCAFSQASSKISYAVPLLIYGMDSVTVIHETEDCSILIYTVVINKI